MSQPPEPRQKTRPDGPRRVRNGLKLRRKEGETEWPWPAATWEQRLVTDVPSEIMIQALEYGRLGQATKLEFGPGLITANVQCEPAKAFKVRIEFPVLSEVAWLRVLQRTAAEAIYAAKLLAGEFPSIVEEPFAETGHPLFPPAEDMLVTCTCGAEGFCRHKVVVGLLVLERLQEFPELAMEIRGRSVERFRTDLQEARMLATRGVSQAHTNPDIVRLAGPIRSIGSRLDEFWRPGPSLEAYRNEIAQKHAHHALLRRLGSSPLEGRFPITGLLASIYDTVMEKSREMRIAAESPPESPEGEDDAQTPSGTGADEPYSSL